MKAQLYARAGLPAKRSTEMLNLIRQHFEEVTSTHFFADLRDKNWVLLMTNDSGRLIGFSTLDFQVTTFKGRTESLLYSGDTIVDPEAWNSTILARSFLEAAFTLHERYGCGRLWWLLITSGFRTYRLLPVFIREFYPRYDAKMPAPVRERLNTFSQERFGSRFDPDTGIVRLEHPQPLRSHLSGIPPNRLRNRHVDFFAQRNPGHLQGDELVSLSILEDANLTTAGKRMIESARRESTLSRS